MKQFYRWSWKHISTFNFLSQIHLHFLSFSHFFFKKNPFTAETKGMCMAHNFVELFRLVTVWTTKMCSYPLQAFLLLFLSLLLISFDPFSKISIVGSLIKTLRIEQPQKLSFPFPSTAHHFFGCLRVNPFWLSPSFSPRKDLTLFFGLFAKATTNAFWGKLKLPSSHTQAPDSDLFRFSHFPFPPYPLIFLKNSKLSSSVKRPSLLGLKNGLSFEGGLFTLRERKQGRREGGRTYKMYISKLYHDDDSYSNYYLNGQPYDTQRG